MKHAITILFTVVCLFLWGNVDAKNMRYIKGAIPLTITNSGKDTCKMGLAMHKCCKAKKQSLKTNDQQYGSVALAFLARLFPVLNNLMSTDTTMNQPCLYHLHA